MVWGNFPLYPITCSSSKISRSCWVLSILEAELKELLKFNLNKTFERLRVSSTVLLNARSEFPL